MTTLKADSKRRVVLPDAQPGQVYVYLQESDGAMVLTPIKTERQPVKGRLEKRGKSLIGLTDRPIDGAALQRALAEFP